MTNESSEAFKAESERCRLLKDLFGNDPEFVFTAITRGWSLQQAQREHTKLRRLRLPERLAVRCQTCGRMEPEVDFIGRNGHRERFCRQCDQGGKES